MQPDNTIKRDPFIDIIKTVAVFLMILGHCIQYGNGNEWYSSSAFLNYPLFKWIYSFHMPLFVMISGFLFYNTYTKYRLRDIVLKKTCSIAVPLGVWCFVDYILKVPVRGGGTGFWHIIKSFISNSIGCLWFLWTILACYAITALLCVLLRKASGCYTFLTFAISFIALNLLTDAHNIMYIKWLIPYFWLGFFLNKHRESIEDKKVEKKKKLFVAITFGLLHFLLLLFYNNSCYIYVGKMYLFREGRPTYQLALDLYRWIIGLVGVIAFVSLLKLIYDSVSNESPRIFKEYNFSVLLLPGRYSLGIYILNNFFDLYLLLPLTHSFSFSTLQTTVEALLMLFIFTLMIRLISRCIPLSHVLFGV
ncbi:MAG: acyltransferase [Lachnospiraceae bacterium]|nr:acyltransferase [Lachnospiraceae bacterium]